MKFLNIVATMAITFSLPAMTAPPTPKCVPSSQPLSSVSGNFSLLILTPDDNGKIDLKNGQPLDYVKAGIYNALYINLPKVGRKNNNDPKIFTLNNKKLVARGLEAVFFDKVQDFNLRYRGLRAFIFDFSGYFNNDPAYFTAVGACDSYGQSFLRLGAADGEFCTLELIFLFFLSFPPPSLTQNIKWSSEPTAHLMHLGRNAWILNTKSSSDPYVLYKPADFNRYERESFFFLKVAPIKNKKNKKKEIK